MTRLANHGSAERRGPRVLAALALVFAVGCAQDPRDDNAARVTIDMRCESNADCPTGFSCAAEQEHGPPTTMCESAADVTCPPGYQTKVGYGQTFCKPLSAAGARSSLAATSRGFAARSTDRPHGRRAE
jgi:hypothetical protein